MSFVIGSDVGDIIDAIVNDSRCNLVISTFWNAFVVNVGLARPEHETQNTILLLHEAQ